jgi:hypothetical protein
MTDRFVDLTALADRFGTDKGSADGDRHLYTEIYAGAFESFRLETFNLLELGLLRSPNQFEEADPATRPVDRIPSIEMWLEYFPSVTCYGFELADFSAYQKPRFTFIRGDLSIDSDIKELASKLPSLRIVIDDASHASYHQQRAFAQLFPLVEPGGFYIIEDLHYSPPFEDELPACRKMSDIFEEFTDTGVLNLDFSSTLESAELAAEIDHAFIHCSARGRPNWGLKLVMLQKRKRGSTERKLGRGTAAGQLSNPPWLTQEWLASRTFAFNVGEQRLPLARSLKFERNGRISGYYHNNETAWRIEDGKLWILNHDGVPSCIAVPEYNEDNTVTFSGLYLFANDGGIHRFEEQKHDGSLPEVRSFDLFDTLVARRCYDPIDVFRLVEAKSGVKDFVRIRREEESKLWHAGDYTLDDIYTALRIAGFWPDDVLRRLKILELSEEWDQLFPIQEMVERVGPDDLIVSDMYLPPNYLRQIVDVKCGLTGRTVHLSSHGKHRGEIWSKIAATHRITQHHGDNYTSDVESARRANLDTEHVTISAWTRGEQILVDAGLRAFAEAVREARLRSFNTDPRLRRAQLAQFEVNLPFLILAGHYALRIAQERNIDVLLMCSRDCNLWVLLMEWLAPRAANAPHVRYFVSSRILFLSNSPEYEAYFTRMRGDRTMLLDVSGTGRSPSYFIGEIGAQASTSILIAAGSYWVANFINDLAAARDDVDFSFISEQPGHIRLPLECLNMSLEGRARRVGFIETHLEIERDDNEFSMISKSIIAEMRAAFLLGLDCIKRLEIRRLADTISIETLRISASNIMELAQEFTGLTAPILDDINREEGNIARAVSDARTQRSRQNI